VFGEGHVYPSQFTCKKIHTKKVHLSIGYANNFFRNLETRRKFFASQLTFNYCFCHGLTCHIMHASHVMISHAHMHITFMAFICSQHCAMTCTIPISLLPYNSKWLLHVRRTAPYDLCSLVVTQSWVRQHYQGIMP
jgi:hypothetical protein